MSALIVDMNVDAELTEDIASIGIMAIEDDDFVVDFEAMVLLLTLILFGANAEMELVCANRASGMMNMLLVDDLMFGK